MRERDSPEGYEMLDKGPATTKSDSSLVDSRLFRQPAFIENFN